MWVMAATLGAAVLQMALLLAVARLLDAAQYATFSLAIAVGLLISALSSEWLRMILARQAAMRRRRVNSALLSGIGRAAEIIAALIACGGFLAAAGAWALAADGVAIIIIAAGIVGAATALSDLLAIYLRFKSTRRAYALFVLMRTMAAGLPTCVAAGIGMDGAACALTFGVGTVVCALAARVVLWRRVAGRRDLQLAMSFARPGFAMATSAIAMHAMAALWRVTAKICLPSEVAGMLLLAVDLGTRGLNVLGAALGSWATRPVFESAHAQDREELERTFKSVSAIFNSFWFISAPYGVAAATIIPLYISKGGVSPVYAPAAAASLVALLGMFLRLFLVDPYVAARGREREIAIAASMIVATSSVIMLTAVLTRSETLALASMPFTLSLSLVVYVFRNRDVLARGLYGRHAYHSAVKVLLVGGGLPIFAASRQFREIAIVLIASVALDIMLARNIYINRHFVR